MITQQLINGLMIDSLCALTVLGATLIYGILRILDTVNAVVYLIGAYVDWYIYLSTGNIILTFLGAILLAGGLDVPLQETVYSPILAKPRVITIVPLMTSVDLFTISNDLVRLIAGPGTKAYNFSFPVESYRIDGLVILPSWILIFALTAALPLILWFIPNKTKLGLAWRATAQDSETTRTIGVDTSSAITLSYVPDYGFAAVTGIMVGILYNSVTPALGEVPSYRILAIIVLGELGNPFGTIIAGIFIGLTEVLASVYTQIPIPKGAIAFVVLIVVLLIKPSGLINQKNKA